MRHIVTATLLTCAVSTAAADPAGLRLTQVDMPHHNSRTGVTIWYPNGGGGDLTQFAENPVFQGVQAAVSADVLDGTHPVVMFSHGMGGTTRAQAWLASGLAARGAIVMSVNHPHSTWGDFDMRDGVKHWTRVADMTAALDALLVDPEFSDHIDASRIMAAGFSYGGWTALSMGGLTGNHAGMVAACADQIDTMAACNLLLSPDVNMQGLNPTVWNDSYADARITHVAAIDPGFVWGLAADDTTGLVDNVLMIGFGSRDDRMSATDFDESGLSGLLPDAQIIQFDPAFHFTAMPLCTPQGAAILIEEQDDPVCTDPDGTNRADVHDDIIEAMARALGL